MKLFAFLLILFQLTIRGFAQTISKFSHDIRGNRTVIIEKGAAPMPTITANQITVNPGELVLLNASGCTGIVTWTPGNVIGNSYQVRPTTNTIYKATCDVVGCASNYSTIQINVLQCPVIPTIIITNNKTNTKYGDEFILSATNCGNQDPDYNAKWSNGYIGDQVKIKQYQTTQTYTVTCFSPDCPTISTGSITVSASPPTACTSIIYTTTNGNWSNPNIWSCRQVPTISQEVLIQHVVDVDQNGEAKTLIMTTGYLNYPNSSFITLPQN